MVVRVISCCLVWVLLTFGANSAEAKTRIAYPKLPSGPTLNKGIPLRDYVYQPNSSEQYFQTWNFYFHSTEGHHLFANFVLSNLGIGDNACGLNISMTTPDGKSDIQTEQLSGDYFTGEPNRLNMKCGESLMTASADTILVKGEYNRLGMDLRITRKTPGLAIKPFYLDDDGEDYVNFNMPHVHSAATGRIKWNGKWIKVTGQAIVAHVNQSVGLHDYSLHWNRIRFLNDDMTLLIGGFVASDDFAEGYTLLVLAKGGQILHATNQVTLKPVRFSHHEKSEYYVPRAFELKAKDKRIDLQATIKTHQEMDEFEVLGHLSWIIRVIAKAFFANPWVFRNGVELDLRYQLDQGPVQTISTKGVHEIIFVND